MTAKTNTNTATKTNAAAAAKAVFDKTPVAKTANPTEPTAMNDLMARFSQAQSDLLEFFNAPSWKRTICAVVTYLAGAVGLAWGTSAVVEYLMVGAIASGASMFIAIAVTAIAAILSVWYGHKAVLRVTGAILTKEADERAVQAYDAVKSLARRFNPFVKLVPAAKPEQA